MQMSRCPKISENHSADFPSQALSDQSSHKSILCNPFALHESLKNRETRQDHTACLMISMISIPTTRNVTTRLI